MANMPLKSVAEKNVEAYVYQCSSCQTVYDEVVGEPGNGIPAGTAFENLSADYVCPVCEGAKEGFKKIKKLELSL